MKGLQASVEQDTHAVCAFWTLCCATWLCITGKKWHVCQLYGDLRAIQHPGIQHED